MRGLIFIRLPGARQPNTLQHFCNNIIATGKEMFTINIPLLQKIHHRRDKICVFAGMVKCALQQHVDKGRSLQNHVIDFKWK